VTILKRRAAEGLAGREPDLAQRLGQILGLDVLVALDVHALERGALEHRDYEGRAFTAQLDVAEKPGRIQGADRLAHALRCQVIANVDRQVVEDRALRDSLQALDLDVADREVCIGRLLCVERTRRASQSKRNPQSAIVHAQPP
jgi:hypothetical protein